MDEMKLGETESYKLPVHEGTSGRIGEIVPDPGGMPIEDDPVAEDLALASSELPTEDEDEEGTVRIAVKDSQTGPPVVTARHEVDGSRLGDYTFRVTDKERHLCAFKYPEKDVPASIHHALIESGWHDVRTSRPPSPWFAGYANTAVALLQDRIGARETYISSHLLSVYGWYVHAVCRAMFIISRYNGPVEVPGDIISIEDVLRPSKRSKYDDLLGDPEQLQKAEIPWSACDEEAVVRAVQHEENWKMQGEYLPLPPRDEETATSMMVPDDPETFHGEGGPTSVEEMDEQITEMVRDHHESKTDIGSPSWDSTPIVTLTYPENEADGDTTDEGNDEYILTTLRGRDGILRHEFRITTPKEETESTLGKCVFEQREEPLPPFMAVHAALSAGYKPTNLPLFFLDADALELVEESYRLVQQIAKSYTPEGMVPEAFTDAVQEPLLPLYPLLLLEDRHGDASLSLKAFSAVADHLGVNQKRELIHNRPHHEIARVVNLILRTVGKQKREAVVSDLSESWIARQIEDPDDEGTPLADVFSEMLQTAEAG